jgi:DNA end-binding protein Ku
MYFVDLQEIDPLFFQHPYYLAPEDGAERSYALFVEAVEKSKKVAIVRFVMRGKEYLGAIRASGKVLLLETMYYPDEIVPTDRLDWHPGEAKVGERELKAAQQLIESLSARFEPEKLKDEYREAVLELVEKKASGEKIHLEPEKEPERTDVSDILAALEASLTEAKKKKHAAHA